MNTRFAYFFASLLLCSFYSTASTLPEGDYHYLPSTGCRYENTSLISENSLFSLSSLGENTVDIKISGENVNNYTDKGVSYLNALSGQHNFTSSSISRDIDHDGYPEAITIYKIELENVTESGEAVAQRVFGITKNEEYNMDFLMAFKRNVHPDSLVDVISEISFFHLEDIGKIFLSSFTTTFKKHDSQENIFGYSHFNAYRKTLHRVDSRWNQTTLKGACFIPVTQ